MATREERQAVIRQARITVHGWPRFMHSVSCGCRACGGRCACPSCASSVASTSTGGPDA